MSHTVRHHLVSYFIASLNEQWGETPFFRAVLSGHADVACFLLESGSDVHEQANVSIWYSNLVSSWVWSLYLLDHACILCIIRNRTLSVWTLTCIYL